MKIRSTILLLTTLFVTSSTPANAKKKTDKQSLDQIKADITFLASDELEGRRTGTPGAFKAAEYLEKRYQQMLIPPYNSTYFHPFVFTYGKEIVSDSRININNVNIQIPAEGFPLAFSAQKKIVNNILPDIMERENTWMVPLYASEEEANNPHFDWQKVAFDRSKEAAKEGAQAIIFFDSYGSKYQPEFDKHSEYEAVSIPVVFINNTAYNKTIGDRKTTVKGINIKLNVAFTKTERRGNNIAAYIDNKAKYTVVLGAHYDHLGYGEDHNSLHANATKDHLIHYGADDNASGTAALLEMAMRIKSNKKKYKHFNYLFVNFSGEELGLYGSKAFVKSAALDSTQIAYMINMDMVGRLNDSTHALTLGGVGTSPSWGKAVEMAGNDFKLSLDSAGVGPSDHTSFYNAGIPVLFFFTGTHKDYHKPSDKANLINYPGELQVINYISRITLKMDKERTKPLYTITKSNTAGKTRFKVTLGIMPDYTFDGAGVRADGVSENRPAAKAGLQTGDIITGLGDHKITGMQSYMEALGAFSPGAKTKVSFVRNGKEMVLPIELNK